MLEFRATDTSETEFAVTSGKRVIAKLYKGTLSVMAGQVVVPWHWTLNKAAGPPGFQQHGLASSFEEAKAEVEAQWTRWLAAAGRLREV